MIERLLSWADERPARHFLVRKCGGCIETRWRVCVWEKPEGEMLVGAPGEGFDIDLPTAVDMALRNWETGKRLDPPRNSQFYAPTRLTGWLADGIERAEWPR